MFKDLRTLRETSILNLKAKQNDKTINDYTRQNYKLLYDDIGSCFLKIMIIKEVVFITVGIGKLFQLDSNITTA